MDLKTLRETAAIPDPITRAQTVSRLMAEQQSLVTEAAKIRRHAIAEAHESGIIQEEIAKRLGVTPGRVSQMRKGVTSSAHAPTPSAEKHPKILVQRALPTPPVVRGSVSLFLVEAEKQGLTPDRRMLYVGTEPASEHIAVCLRVEPGENIVARRKLMSANGIPVRIATSFFRANLFGETRIAEPEFVRPSLQAALEALGYRFGHAGEHLTARRPTAFERQTLELDPDEWVVEILRTSYSVEDTPVHALETICAASRHLFPIGQVAGTDEF